MSQNGALTQLVAVGAQEKNFISNDEKDSLFKESDKKINNFVKSSQCIYPIGNADWDTTTKFKIEKKGDLLGSIYLSVHLPDLNYLDLISNESIDTSNNKTNYVRWVNYIGNALVKRVKLYFDGQLIDEQTGEFMQVYTDIQDDDWNKLCLIGMNGNLNKPLDYINGEYLYIPLKFWFCEGGKKALPLISMQYTDIEIEVEFRKLDECYQVLKFKKEPLGEEGMTAYNYEHIDFVHTKNKFKKEVLSKLSLKSVSLDCNFYYVDNEERKRLSEKEHKILITQTQSIISNINNQIIELDFNHPVKEMFWFFSNKSVKESPEPLNFSNMTEYPDSDVFDGFISKKGWGYYNYMKKFKDHWMDEARILVNGRELVGWNNWKYYYYTQNYENYRNKMEHLVYLYSFSTNPKSSSPAGSLNFSRVDNAQLQFTMNQKTKDIFNGLRMKSSDDISNNYKSNNNQFTIQIYAVNYNYLIIKNGMAGVAYKT